MSAIDIPAAQPARAPGSRGFAPGLAAAAVIALVALPLVVQNRYYLHLCNLVLLNALLVIGLGIVTKAGQLSLCPAAFAGVGAYASALLAMQLGVPPALGIFLSAGLAALLAYPIGLLILRLRGVYFVLVTYLLGQMFQLIVINWTALTHGSSGLVGIPSLKVAEFGFTTPGRFYWLLLGITCVVAVGVWALLRSPLGRAFASTEENLVLAEASGIDTRRCQVIAFSLGSGIAGLSGALSAHYIHFISPDSFTFWQSVGAIVMLVVGGKASLWGWLLGAAFITPLPEVLHGAKEMQYILYGAILIGVLKFFPGGIVSMFRMPAKYRRLSGRAVR